MSHTIPVAGAQQCVAIAFTTSFYGFLGVSRCLPCGVEFWNKRVLWSDLPVLLLCSLLATMLRKGASLSTDQEMDSGHFLYSWLVWFSGSMWLATV